MNTPTLPAAVRDTIANAIDHALSAPCYDIARDRMAQDVCAALGPVWAAHEADSKRLDWLELCETGRLWHVSENGMILVGPWHKHSTLRAAIDAARTKGYDYAKAELGVLVADVRRLGAAIPCNTGGTFQNDPPDAIIDAAIRTLKTRAELIAHKDDQLYRENNQVLSLRAELAAANAPAKQYAVEAGQLAAQIATLREALQRTLEYVVWSEDEGRHPDDYPEAVAVINADRAKAEQALAATAPEDRT